jgi:hypothetical protein
MKASGDPLQSKKLLSSENRQAGSKGSRISSVQPHPRRMVRMTAARGSSPGVTKTCRDQPRTNPLLLSSEARQSRSNGSSQGLSSLGRRRQSRKNNRTRKRKRKRRKGRTEMRSEAGDATINPVLPIFYRRLP